MIKVILFDIDGIIITGRKHLFSERLASEYNISQELVEEFFRTDFRECTFGRADLKEKISPHLDKWNWGNGVEKLLEYWFTSENKTDKEVLDTVSRLRSRGIKCYIATRQEKYRSRYLLETLGLRKYFDGAFITCDIGYDKSQTEFWEYVLKKLEAKPEEIMFFDDTTKNIQFAESLGVKAIFYENINTLQKHTTFP